MQLSTFRFRWVPFLATLAGLALFVHLGLWQAGKGERLAAELAQRAQRLQEAPQRIAAMPVDAAALVDAPVVVSGRYEPAQQFYLDNRQQDGQPGVEVLTPLRIDGSDLRILVDRGWTAWTRGSRLPELRPPEGLVQVRGVAFQPSTRKPLWMPERAEADPRLWERLDLARFAALTGHALQPLVVLQDAADARDGLVRRWPAPENKVGMHRGYAFQWFGMALALLVFYLVAGFRQGAGA